MRVKKTVGSIYTRYSYAGQMPVEEFHYYFIYPANAFIKQVRDGLGARGIDWIEKTQQNNTVITGYPVYDGHGNMIACLFKNGSSYSINDQRSYDAWGNIRSGNTTGDPKARYVANLGHLADDESGLTYMRARYYEPSSGRFVSEDPAGNGGNWYTYCSNNPISRVDKSGKKDYIKEALEIGLIIIGFYYLEGGIVEAYYAVTPAQLTVAKKMIWIGLAALTLAYAAACTSDWHQSFAVTLVGLVIGSWIDRAIEGLAAGAKTEAAAAVVASFAYALTVSYFIIQIFVDEQGP
jgi:RHS repeat-associated protein